MLKTIGHLGLRSENGIDDTATNFGPAVAGIDGYPDERGYLAFADPVIAEQAFRTAASTVDPDPRREWLFDKPRIVILFYREPPSDVQVEASGPVELVVMAEKHGDAPFGIMELGKKKILFAVLVQVDENPSPLPILPEVAGVLRVVQQRNEARIVDAAIPQFFHGKVDGIVFVVVPGDLSTGLFRVVARVYAKSGFVVPMLTKGDEIVRSREENGRDGDAPFREGLEDGFPSIRFVSIEPPDVLPARQFFGIRRDEGVGPPIAVDVVKDGEYSRRSGEEGRIEPVHSIRLKQTDLVSLR